MGAAVTSVQHDVRLDFDVDFDDDREVEASV